MEKSPHAAAAAAIRKELKVAFPNTKFRVISSSFAGGNSVSVGWVDGPTMDGVRGIVDKYQYGHFDGMDDLYKNTNVIEGMPQVKYVSPSRDMSDTVRAALTQEIGRKYGVDMSDDRAVFEKLHMWPSTAVYREFSDREYK